MHPLTFLGSGAFGLPTLQHLAQHHNLAAIFTQPDRPAGRKRKLTPTPIADYAQTHLPHIPLHKPENINTPQHLEQFHALLDQGDGGEGGERGEGGEGGAAIVIAFGQKLSRDLIADRFAINLHASLLPRWRGAAPIVRAMLAGDAVTGNSVITIADRMDAGLVLAKTPPERQIKTNPPLTAGELHDQLAAEGPILIQEVLDNHARGTLQPETQDESLVTKANKLTKADGHADFNQPAETVARTINALNPWPAVTATFRDQPVKLLRAVPADPAPADHAHKAAPGSVADPNAGLIACAGGSTIQLLELQPAGKKTMTWQAFANGLRPTAADAFHPPTQ